MIHTSTPGTLMLMGEHAVLNGSHCLVTATDQRLHVYLTPRKDRNIHIISTLGALETTIENLTIREPFSFVLAVLKRFQKQFPSGFDLRIDNRFSATVGLGSSAAVLVATTQAILKFLDFQLQSNEILFDLAYQTLLTVQGCGSGADLAASILGGVVLYRQKPFLWEKIATPLFPITLVYAGYKTSTPEVIKIVEQARNKDPKKFSQIFTSIDEAVLFARDALIAEEGDIQAFISAFTSNQKFMIEMGVVDETLQKIVDLLLDNPAILGAKVSGSGLGDCVLGIGKTNRVGNYDIIPAQLAEEGLILHDHYN